jgi:hypothetical protein
LLYNASRFTEALAIRQRKSSHPLPMKITKEQIHDIIRPETRGRTAISERSSRHPLRPEGR